MARPVDRRAFERELRKLCKAHDLDVSFEARKGSHRGIALSDPAQDRKVLLVITNEREISSGVQREIVRYITELSARCAVAEVVREILHKIFSL